MPRVIRYFDKAGESFKGEINLPDIPLLLLQKLFDINSDNPMYDSYIIEEWQERFFKKYTDLLFEFDRFDYFLEYDA